MYKNEPTSDADAQRAAKSKRKEMNDPREVYDLNLVSPRLFSYYIYWSIRSSLPGATISCSR